MTYEYEASRVSGDGNAVFPDDVENTYDEYEERLRMEYGVTHLVDLRYYERWHDENIKNFSELGSWEIDD